MNPTVSIITTTSNPTHHVPKLLESLGRQSYADYEVIIVEHGYPQKTDRLKVPENLKDKLQLLRFKKNLGFCKANNLAAREARGKYLFLVNDDVTLGRDCLRQMVERIEREEGDRIAVIQPKIRSSKFPNFFEYAGAAGGLIDKYGYPFCRGRVIFTIEEDREQFEDPAEIFWAAGTAFFIRKELFLNFGGFDERFFAYHEETDLCWQLRRAGYRVVFEPKAIVYHRGEQSWRNRRFLKIFLIHRNHYWLLAKNHSSTYFVKLLPVKIFLDLASFFYYAIHGGFTSCVAAILGGTTGLFLSLLFLNQHQQRNLRIRQFNNKIIYPGSIAIAYFLKGKRTYHELMEKKKLKDIKTKKYAEFY